MKKIALISIVVALGMLPISAKTLNVKSGNVVYAYPAETAGDVTVSINPESITILNKEYLVSDLAKIYVDESEVTDNTVSVSYAGTQAVVTISGNIADYVTATVEGAHVRLIQSADVSDASCGEITYILSGESDNGSFYMEGSYKATLELQGLSLTNPSDAAINIQNGKRIDLSAKKGTVNTIADGASGSQKGALVCKGHLEIKGKGTLNVIGNASHAIYAKEYVEVKNLTLNILGSVKDGINCSQYFLLESGELNITGVGDDAIQTDYKDAENREAEDTGTVIIAGGKLTAQVTATAAKGIKAEGCVNVTDGEIEITVSGKGMWDSAKTKTKASSCISSDENVTIGGGTLNLRATGSGGKGINCDGVFTMNGGDLNIITTGGMFAYVNNREYDGYTGNTDRLDSNAKSSPKGIKADTEVVINGGNVNVCTSGNGGEGIESKGTLTVNDGKIKVRAYDDAINSSGHMYLEGGEIDVISTNNDGLDSNGNLYMRGGYVMAFGASSPECGIDANEEQGYTVIFTGGTLLAVGGGNSTPTQSESTQAYVSGNGSVSKGTMIELKNGDEVMASFTVPEDYTSTGSTGGGGWRPGGMGGGSSILITTDGLESGSKYTLKNGTNSSSVTATLKGSGTGRPR